MAKHRCIKLKRDLSYDEKYFTVEAGNIKETNKSDVKFLPVCVFKENKPRRVFWRGAKRLIFFVEDALHAIRFDTKEAKLGLLQLAWGKKEAREYLFKLEALAQAEGKPLTMWQFAFLIILNIVGIAGIIYTLMVIRGIVGG